MAKILVAYFSATGTTARVAKELAQTIGGELFQITPAIPYTPQDLNWNDKNSRSSLETSGAAPLPLIAGKIADFEQWNPIFLGFPIWWYNAPRIIDAFLQEYDFSGKKIAVFATSGGSPLGHTIEELKKICPNADWLPGKMLRPGASGLAEWAKNVCA